MTKTILFVAMLMLAGCGKPSEETKRFNMYQVSRDEFNGHRYLIFTAHPNGGIFVMEEPNHCHCDTQKVKWYAVGDSIEIQIKGESK